MLDDDWEAISGDAAHSIEALNLASQINLIRSYIQFYMHHHAGSGRACLRPPDRAVLSELHRVGTFLLLHRPGEIRETNVVLGNDLATVFRPPGHGEIGFWLDAFFGRLAEMWRTRSPLAIAAYVLWKINWIHPFSNGNGRTARAFAYLCVCLRYGFEPPGPKSLIALILRERARFEAALREADRSFAEFGQPDLLPLQVFLEGLLVEQFESAGLDRQ